MGAWGTEWNANDRVADLVGDISSIYKYDALNRAGNVINTAVEDNFETFEELIDYYRASAMIYKNITLSLGDYRHVTEEESVTFANANKIVEDFLSEHENDDGYESIWGDFVEYAATVRSELHEFQEWLQTD